MPSLAERDWKAIGDRLAKEELMPIAKAARLVPTGRGGRGHASSSALFRWIISGKLGVYLDAIKLGAGWCTSREAIIRFGAEVGKRERGEVQATVAPSPATLREREQRANAAIAKMNEGRVGR